MPIGKRFIYSILFGTLLILVGYLFNISVEVFIAYNLILFSVFVLDLLITPSKNDFEVNRICEEKFSLGCENKVSIKVRNNSRHKVNLILKDDIPNFFIYKIVKENEFILDENRILENTVMPNEEGVFEYFLIPEKRGEFKFGNINIKFSGVIGLCQKQFKFDSSFIYKVYPNLKDLSKHTLANVKKNLILSGNKKIKSFYGGNEFESLSEYSYGDDFRKINWTATARNNRLIVNLYQPEKNQDVYIMVDCSRGMNSEINYIKKLDYSLNASTLLADLVLKNDDRIGLLVFDNKIRKFVKAGKGIGQFNLLIENMYNVSENLVSSSYWDAFLYFNKNQHKRSLICLFTQLDNVEETKHLLKSIKAYLNNHKILIISIKDLRIYESLDKPLNNEEDIYIKSSSIKLIDEERKIENLLRHSGVELINIPPDKLSLEVVNQYLIMKASFRM